MLEYLATAEAAPGNSVTALCRTTGLFPSCTILCSSPGDEGVPRISRCLVSSSSFPSESEPSPSSKVSASVRSASEAIGSSERRCRDVGEEVRDRKDGGGEDGIEFVRSGRVGFADSS